MRQRIILALLLPSVTALGLTGSLSASASPAPVGLPSGDLGASSYRSTCTIAGTPRDDVLLGTSGKDVICGLGGNDTIRGLGGRDVLYGGSGKDRLFGGPGKDELIGESGEDELSGGAGDDFLGGGGQDGDVLNGGPGQDDLEDREPLQTDSKWSVRLEPNYQLPAGTTVRWRFTGASDCIDDLVTDFTDKVGDPSSSRWLFTVPTSFLDRCAWVSSSAYWELTVTPPGGKPRMGQFFVHTGNPNRLYHNATAECRYWSDVNCEDYTDSEMADYGPSPLLKPVVGPLK